MGYFDDPQFHQEGAKAADTEPTWAEKYIAPLISNIAATHGVDLGNLAGGNVRGSWAGRLAQGAADPGVAAVQLGANAIGQGAGVNQAISNEEKQYQDARKGAGSTGFDPLRIAGNIAVTAPLGGVGGAAESTIGQIAKGATQGAGFGALQPVDDAEKTGFWGEKAKQAGIGAVGGAIAAPTFGAIARVISPNASVNPNLKMLTEEGVQPSIGQTLGGIANTLEEKLQSVPILGDAITAMRTRARDQFNNAAINRATAPIGVTIEGSGQEAVGNARKALSNAYDGALSKIQGVNFDTPEFNASLGQLQGMSEHLTPEMRAKFGKTLNDLVIGRMSPNGSMLGETMKGVDSELGQLASKYSGSSTASEQEFGDAVLQLKTLLNDQVKRSHPDVAPLIDAADKGWANLVRVQGASKAAMNNEGRFTPAQLNAAARTGDDSVRKSATAEGDALMQDLGNAGQQVLGNKYPDSGTIGRGLAGAAALGTGVINPAIPAALVGGAAAYQAPIQNFLRYLATQRPDVAPKVANKLRELTLGRQVPLRFLAPAPTPPQQ